MDSEIFFAFLLNNCYRFRAGPLREAPANPRVSGRVGPGPEDFPVEYFPENFLPDFFKKMFYPDLA